MYSAFPSEGRFRARKGWAFFWAGRLTRIRSGTITVSVNDYGFELLGTPRLHLRGVGGVPTSEELLDGASLQADLEASIIFSELGRRRFRVIAQVAAWW